MAKSKFQNFEMETINRRSIKNADYNPRYMGEKEKKKLRAALKENGLVSALTWNKRTGNLVGGHQRLEQLDALEKSDDYDLTVCVIDVDEKQEAKLNVQLNNPSMQGEWDLDKLAEMTDMFDISLDDMGFSEADATFMFDGDERFTELFETPEAADEKDKIKQLREKRERGKQEMEEDNLNMPMVTIVFEDHAARNEFMKEIHVEPHERYITVQQVRRLMG